MFPKHDQGEASWGSQDNLVKVMPKQVTCNKETTFDSTVGLQTVQIELERTEATIDAEISKLIKVIEHNACQGDAEKARSTLQALLKVGGLKRTIAEARDRLIVSAYDDSTPIYTVGSWFLYECYHYLVQKEVEALHYATGVQFGNVFTLDKLVTFKMSHQTLTSAKGGINSTHAVLIEMENYGHKLHAHFHSHPGKGEAATSPSSVDSDYQSRLEKGGREGQ